MGDITYSDAIAIVQVVFYSPALLASIFVCLRHGFTKATGWYFLVTFCLLRLIGPSAELYTINNSSSTADEIAITCSSIGTSALLLASLGLLSRIYYSILSPSSNGSFQNIGVRLIQTVLMIGLILGIVGATQVSDPEKIEEQKLVHVGIVLYLIAFIAILALAITAFVKRSTVPSEERILIAMVALAMPFIFVHIIYSLLEAFSHSSTFSPETGSKTAELCMSVLEEIVVVFLYLIAGIRVGQAPAGLEAAQPQSRRSRAPRSRGPSENFRDDRRERGLLRPLVFAAADAIKDRTEGGSAKAPTDERTRQQYMSTAQTGEE